MLGLKTALNLGLKYWILIGCTVGQSAILRVSAQKNVHIKDSLLSCKVDSFKRSIGTNIPIGMIPFGLSKYYDTSKGVLKQPELKIGIPKASFKWGGNFSIQAFYSEIVNPRALNENQYIRFSATPEITLFGLPFRGEVYYTTEENKIYNTNFIGFSFDKQKFLDQMKLQILGQVNEYKSNLSNLNKSLQKQEFDLAIIKRQMALERRKIQFDSLQLVNNFSYLDKLDTLRDASIDSLDTDSMYAKMSETRRKVERRMVVADSMYQVLGKKYIEAEEKVETIKRIYEQTMQWVNRMDSALKDPNVLVEFASGGNYTKRIVKTLGFLERFNIGNIQPTFGEITLVGLPARGIDFEYGNKWITKVSIGKTFSQYLSNQLMENKIKYQRNLLFAGFGYRLKFGSSIFTTTHLWDQKFENGVKEHNHLLGLLNDYHFSSKWKISTESFISFYNYKSISNELSNEVSTNESRVNTLDRSAILAKSEYNLSKNSQLEAKYFRLGTFLQNIGNPFLRRDYREIKINYRHLLFQSKLRVSTFYQNSIDNLKKISSYTNKVTGFGFQLQTSFVKYPNVFISYTPFTQGAQHPDSLLRTNNQFSTKTASVSYQRLLKRVRYSMVINYIEGVMQFGDQGDKMFNRSIQSQVGVNSKKLQGGISFAKSFNEGGVDTLAFSMYQFNLKWSVSKKWRTGSQLQFTYYNNDGNRLFGSIFLELQGARNMEWRWQLGYQYIEGIWGITKNGGLVSQMALNFRI